MARGAGGIAYALWPSIVYVSFNQMNAGDPPMARRNREVQILAKSIYRDMTSQGFDKSDIVNLATALLEQVTSKMAAETPQRD